MNVSKRGKNIPTEAKYEPGVATGIRSYLAVDSRIFSGQNMPLNRQDQGATRGLNKVNPIQLVNISQTQTVAIPNLVDFFHAGPG